MDYKVSNLALDPGYTDEQLRAAAAKSLGIRVEDVREVMPLRESVDARKKSWVHCAVTCMCKVASGVQVNADAEEYNPKRYVFPYHDVKAPKNRPVVVGTGPAGIFCAYGLALAGLKPIIVERGDPVERRTRMVEHFFETGHLSHITNVQFGEGGAGTFSDGKLATGTKDPRQQFVLETYVAEGAPKDILYLAKPHMGTDKLRAIAARIRHDLGDLGCTFAFDTQLVGIRTENGHVCGAVLEGPERMWTQETGQLVLAPGNGARDTFRMLQTSGVELEAKGFAVGLRIEHLQEAIDMAQYGTRADFNNLPAADYKVTCHTSGGRAVYSFCVCPGGEVVAATSEENSVVTNGMSCYDRNGANCNGALVVGVGPQDFGSDNPLAGIAYQRTLEEAAFKAGGGDFTAPIQLAGDFLTGRQSTQLGSVIPTYKPAVRFADLRSVLPEPIWTAIVEAMPAFGRKIQGFDADDAVLTAVETRTSSPVRILRDPETYESRSVRGLYPCGEGAGYAGGIMSAATDGLRCAEKVCEALL